MGVPEKLDELKNDIQLFIVEYNMVKAENQLLKNELEQVKKELDHYKGENNILSCYIQTVENLEQDT